MIDACVKMECLGCHKLIPTVQFYEHLIDSDFENHQVCHEGDVVADEHYNLGDPQQQQNFEGRSKSVGRR